MQIPSGYLIDEFGAKRIAITMASACAFGSIIMYFSFNFYLLLLSRLVIGFDVLWHTRHRTIINAFAHLKSCLAQSFMQHAQVGRPL